MWGRGCPVHNIKPTIFWKVCVGELLPWCSLWPRNHPADWGAPASSSAPHCHHLSLPPDETTRWSRSHPWRWWRERVLWPWRTAHVPYERLPDNEGTRVMNSDQIERWTKNGKEFHGVSVTLSNELLDQLRARHPDECTVSVVGYSSGQQGLPCTRGAVQ